MNVEKLLRSLRDHKVKFLLIGAWSFPAYGYERMTGDVDIFIETTEENAQKTKDALKALGYRAIEDLPLSTMLTKKVLLRQYILRTDIHPFVAGIDFQTAWKHRKRVTVKGINVFVPSLADIITMKKAAGRKKDQLDLETLLIIDKRKSKKS